MWVFEQSTGKMHDASGKVLAQGYSGRGEGKNNPAMQTVPCVGPIPIGTYTIAAPRDGTGHGPYAMRLSPDETNQMFGRAGFMIHGDNVHAPGTASEGCIILPRDAREQLWKSGDFRLEVIWGEQEKPAELTNHDAVQDAAAGEN